MGQPHLAGGTLDDSGEDRLEGGLVEGLAFEQLVGQIVEHVAVVGQRPVGVGMGGIDDGPDLGVDRGQGRIPVLVSPAVAAPGEGLGLVVADLDHAQLLAHAVLGDHLAGDARGLLDVVAGPGGRVVEDDLLGHAPAHGIGELVEQLIARRRVLVLARQHHGVAQGPTARKDRHLRDRIRLVHRRRDQGVTALVVGGDEAFLVVHQAGPLLGSGDDAVDGLIQDPVVDDLRVLTGGQQGRLVEDVGQISTRESGGALGDLSEIDFLGQGFVRGMDLEDVLAALHVRGFDGDLPVEAARAQQRRVEDIGAVGRGDEDDIGLDVEAVHLHEELVERLLAFVVAATHAGAALAADGVDLVDEDDAGGVGLGLFEQVADAGGADADVHLDEVGAGDRVEGHSRLAGHGLREQCLTGARLSVEEHALGDLRTDGLELLGLGEEFLDLLELFESLVDSGHVLERDVGVLLVDELGLRFAEVHHLPARHLGDEEPEDDEDDDEGDEGSQQGHQPGLLGHLVGESLVRARGVDGLDDLLTALLDVEELDLLAEVLVADLVVLFEGEIDALVLVDDLGLLDLVVAQQIQTLFGVDLAEPDPAEEQRPDGHHQQGHHDPDQRPLRRLVEQWATLVRLGHKSSQEKDVGNRFRLPRLPGNIPHSLVPVTGIARMGPALFPVPADPIALST